MLDSVNHIPFKLTVWNNNGGEPGSIIHQQEVYPKHTKDAKFHYYYLDSLFQIVGTFYVGWEQQTNDLLNIGLDKNKLANQYMFYNVGSGWNNSIYPGSWMIRPIVSMEQIISAVVDLKPSFRVYPNPTVDILIIESKTDKNQISIYSIQGVLLKEMYSEGFITSINITDLSPAVYFIEVLNKEDKQYQKFIIK
jgi:hypothetical protein